MIPAEIRRFVMGTPNDLNRCEYFLQYQLPDKLCWPRDVLPGCENPFLSLSRHRIRASRLLRVLQSVEIARFQPVRSRADSGDSAPGERRNRSSKGVPKRYIPVVFPRG
jgi:hypothetical protein